MFSNLIENSKCTFGSVTPGRSFVSNSYRYGFNGKEKDDEVKGSGNSYDFGSRIYDSRLGRWLAIDMSVDKYPSFSPYIYTINNPLSFVDGKGTDIDPSGIIHNSTFRAGFKLFNSIDVGKEYLSLFANVHDKNKGSLKSLGISENGDGILKNHVLKLNTTSKKIAGETKFFTIGKDGKPTEFEAGTKITEDTRFQIEIYLNPKEIISQAGTAGVIGHEAFIHTDDIINLIVAFEKAKETKDPEQIKVALGDLQNKMDEKYSDFKKAKNKDHLQIATNSKYKKLFEGIEKKIQSMKEPEKTNSTEGFKLLKEAEQKDLNEAKSKTK